MQKLFENWKRYINEDIEKQQELNVIMKSIDAMSLEELEELAARMDSESVESVAESLGGVIGAAVGLGFLHGVWQAIGSYGEGKEDRDLRAVRAHIQNKIDAANQGRGEKPAPDAKKEALLNQLNQLKQDRTNKEASEL
jgi:hypothetical protein